jgi:predicted tellurium resistance membrane protein TerC
MDWLTNPEIWIALVTLTALEIVLGIDNIIFLSIVAGKLPAHQQRKARRIGLVGAMVMRLALLLSLAWIMRLTGSLFEILGQEISGRDLILIGGGLFLLAKGTHEIHDKLEGEEGRASGKVAHSFAGVIAQIMALDMIFSLDSVITAVGMVKEVWVMAAAIIIAVVVMLISVEPLSAFVERHPTIKVLALAFLLLIGVTLIAEGFGHEIPRGYIYFALGFSVFVEMLNLRVRKRVKPVELRQPYSTGEMSMGA